jgi:hypothetical protein
VDSQDICSPLVLLAALISPNSASVCKLLQRPYKEQYASRQGGSEFAGEVCLSAFSHYKFLSFQLSDVLPSSQEISQASKAQYSPQKLLLCPALSRLFVAFGNAADSYVPGVPNYICNLIKYTSYNYASYAAESDGERRPARIFAVVIK